MSAGRRWIFYLLSLIGLAVGLSGAFRLRALSELPPDFALRGGFPARVEGVVAGSAAELRFLSESHPAGSAITIGPVTGGNGAQRVRLVPQLSRTQLLLNFADGLLFLIVNLLVFCPRLDRAGARAFYWLTLVAGVSILIGGLYFPRGGAWPGAALALTWIVCLTVLPLYFVQLGLTFPRRYAWLDRHASSVAVLHTLTWLLIAWQWWAYLRYFAEPRPELWHAARVPRLIAQGYLVLGMLTGFALLFRGLRVVELTRERQQLKWLLWGFAIGITPYVFLRTLPALLGGSGVFGPAFDRICEMTVPVAFTFAIARWQFLDIDLIIQRSLLYTGLAVVLAAIYLFLAVIVGERLDLAIPGSRPYVRVAAAMAAAALLNPSRKLLARWIDLTLFQISHQNALALRELRAALPAAVDDRAVAGLLCRALDWTMRPTRCGVVDARGEPVAAGGARSDGAAAGGAGSDGAAADVATSLAALTTRLTADDGARPIARPGSTSLPEIENAAFAPDLEAAGVRIAMPLRAGGQRQGWLWLGDKSAGRLYIERDLALIESAAAEAGIALERIALVRKAAAEEQEKQRLADLDRLKSDFLSRVAHDLRSPLTAIGWSADNLLDGLAGEVGEKQAEYLRAIKGSTGQLARLVTNLLEISRLEAGRPRLALAPVALRELFAEAIATLAPAAGARGVRFNLRAAADVPPARGDRDKLVEVATNLLENAVRFSPEGGNIDVSIEAEEGARLRLGVRDHGPGIAEGESELIFERFRQGRPSPYATPTGFGLGLYIVRSYLRLMGGDIVADNHPEGGARFTGTLPVRRDATEEQA